jgi:hypothetical protein
MDTDVLKEVFAKTEEPLGYYFAGRFSHGRERFDFWKKSAEGGCSWGQLGYAWYFRYGGIVEQDKKIYVEWLEKAANRNNPNAMQRLGGWFRWNGWNKEMAVSYYQAAAELGWKRSIDSLAVMLRDGEGCEKDLRQAVVWSSKVKDTLVFWQQLEEAHEAFESGMTENLDCDFDQLCYSIGSGLFWYQYCSTDWNEQNDENKVFGNRCLEFYCSCVELQQKSIFTFLLCWNQTTRGVKGPGQMIARLVWNAREDNLVHAFGQNEGEEPEMKQIKT